MQRRLFLFTGSYLLFYADELTGDLLIAYSKYPRKVGTLRYRYDVFNVSCLACLDVSFKNSFYFLSHHVVQVQRSSA